jgi:hypothetical protein
MRCENAGISVDDKGRFVIAGQHGLVSPNSSILSSVRDWPLPIEYDGWTRYESGEQSFALSSDGATLYLLDDTAPADEHPNRVYRLDLSNARPNLIEADASRAWATIAAGRRFVYVVDQFHAELRRAPILRSGPRPVRFISGPKTRLTSPVEIAVDPRSGNICVVNLVSGASNELLCYSSSEVGNASPLLTLHMTHFNAIDQLAFDKHGDIVVGGSLRLGPSDFEIDVIHIGADDRPIVERRIGGRRTSLSYKGSLNVAADAASDIIALTTPDNSVPREVMAFGPTANGDVPPKWTRRDLASLSNPSGIAVDTKTNSLAIRRADGVTVYPESSSGPQWTKGFTIPILGQDVSFSPTGILVVADFFGNLQGYQISPRRHVFTAGDVVTDLNAPNLITTDQDGRVYTVSPFGLVTVFAANPRFGSKPEKVRLLNVSPSAFAPEPLAFAADSSGYLYFTWTDGNVISVLDRAGNQHTLAGPATHLDGPTGLAVAPDGSLFVANTLGHDVLVFGRGSQGDTTPIGKIAGPLTNLSAPRSVAVSNDGHVYVFESAVSNGATYVWRYPEDARGNVRPSDAYVVHPRCNSRPSL